MKKTIIVILLVILCIPSLVFSAEKTFIEYLSDKYFQAEEKEDIDTMIDVATAADYFREFIGQEKQNTDLVKRLKENSGNSVTMRYDTITGKHYPPDDPIFDIPENERMKPEILPAPIKESFQNTETE